MGDAIGAASAWPRTGRLRRPRRIPFVPMRGRRVSRWDRPPGPRDIRWFLRLVGKILICTGLLMFGFVAYQLWGTGIEYARAQDRAEDQFNEMLERVSTSTPTPTTTSTSSTTSTTSTTTTFP